MVKQKLISFKIHEDLLPEIDQLCLEYGLNRNCMFNVLIRAGVYCLNDKRAKYAIIDSFQHVDFK